MGSPCHRPARRPRKAVVKRAPQGGCQSLIAWQRSPRIKKNPRRLTFNAALITVLGLLHR